MISSTCARCAEQVKPGDLVVNVRVVSRIYPPGDSLATDRGNAVAHIECPNTSAAQNRSE